MNEARHKIMLNMAGNTKPKEDEDWQDLIQQFKTLQLRVTSSAYADIFQEITKIIESLETNNPKAKIYRARKKRLQELTLLVYKPR